jgi:uncharacterized membrane protein YfcA
MLLVGILAVWEGRGYPFGALSRIGPGLFPTVLGALLALVGAYMLATSRAHPPRESERAPLEWKAWLLIAAGVVAFIVLGTYGGLFPASFAIVFLSALGDRKNTPKSAAILALTMSCAAVIIFYYGLHLQFPLFTWG